MSERVPSNVVVDIAIPVLNEEQSLERSVKTLARHLRARCPHDWLITIVDNGSEDSTWAIASSLAESFSCVRAIHLDQRGRGAALKAAWSSSNGDVMAYMDVDLSTGLDALPRLIEPIVAGLADVSIGSRLAPGARIQWSVRRELISRTYNLISRLAFGYGVSDAQCGFKAISAEVSGKVLGEVEDNNWFFDTELLVLAWRKGFGINEVPVRWIEDRGSRARITRTASDDLRGIRRLFRGHPFQRPRLRASRKESLPEAEWHPTNSDVDPGAEFDLYATRYEQDVDRAISFTGRDSDFFAQRKADLLGELALRHLGDLGKLSVLDVGCGTGTTCRHLVGRAAQLCGVDISDEMLSVARENVAGVDFKWYDGDRLPFRDSTFDIVITVCALHHVPTPRRPEFVSELHRVTREDGLIIIFEHNPLNPVTRWVVHSCELDKGVTLVPSWRATDFAREAGALFLGQTNFLFTPLAGGIGRQIDGLLGWLPIGGQYAMVARANHTPARGTTTGTGGLSESSSRRKHQAARAMRTDEMLQLDEPPPGCQLDSTT